MLVDSNKMKHMRLSKNWTQQHLAEVCGVSMRTIQRVEKDGVASNETVASYAAVFEMPASDFLITIEEFDNTNRSDSDSALMSRLGGLIFIGGFAAGIGAGVALALWLI
ncbi:hypothetical protein NBRC116583_29420 [Arenicella sp. 4NH20-0111]|uniref:helix-turn-helix transcriptional regulator n=1 Tax=Arenicella sp. 4NH20-0111 TaxID=3127648 RepID=UPI0031051226